MKKTTLALSVILSASSVLFARVQNPVDIAKTGNPNSIQCQSKDGTLKLSALLSTKEAIFFVLTVTSPIDPTFTSDLQLGYLTMDDSPMGLLISGIDERFADATVSYTLVVPDVTVDLENESPVLFDTKLVRSFSGGFWYGPVPAGAHTTNDFIDVSCSAQFTFVAK